MLGPRPDRRRAPAPPTRRRDAAVRRRLVRLPRVRDAPPHRLAARTSARRRPADRAARHAVVRPHALPPALRWPAAATQPRHGDRRPPRAGVPRRADRRTRPAGAPLDVGAHQRAALQRRHRRADDALHGRGRGARRRRPHRRRGPGHRVRHASGPRRFGRAEHRTFHRPPRHRRREPDAGAARRRQGRRGHPRLLRHRRRRRPGAARHVHGVVRDARAC